MYNLGLISRYRTQLMGVATILILLCHAPAYVDLPPIVSAILSRGGLGVDIFFFLSGVGLWFSLSKSPHLKKWYYWRYMRLLIPYLIIYAPLTIIRGVISNNDPLNVIGEISTISFWTRHSSAWFVAVLIPLYLLAPLIFMFFERTSSTTVRIIKMMLLVCFCIILSSISIDGVESKTLIYNIQFALSRIPSFIFGLFIGPYVGQDYKFRYPFFFCIIIGILAFILKYSLPTFSLSIFMFLPVLMVISICFSKEVYIINTISNFMGKISLESYLFNVTLPFFVIGYHVTINGVNCFYKNYLPYLLVILIGTIMSIVVNRLTKSIFHSLQK